MNNNDRSLFWNKAIKGVRQIGQVSRACIQERNWFRMRCERSVAIRNTINAIASWYAFQGRNKPNKRSCIWLTSSNAINCGSSLLVIVDHRYWTILLLNFRFHSWSLIQSCLSWAASFDFSNLKVRA